MYQYNELFFLLNAAVHREGDLRPFFLINIKDKRLQYANILWENSLLFNHSTAYRQISQKKGTKAVTGQ